MTSGRVVVVGAGPVGLTAALVLARAGVEVEVAESHSRPGDLPRAISIVDETFRTMSRFGLADELLAQSNTDTGSRYLGRDGRVLVTSKPVESRFGYPGKSLFDQPIMEAQLWAAAIAEPHITLHTSARATRVEQDDQEVRLTFTSPHGTTTIRADWMVAADGGKSFVREALGIEMDGATQPERWIVVDLLGVTRSYDKFADFHCDPRRPHVVVPGIDGRLRLEFMLFEEEDPERMTAHETIRELVLPFRPELNDDDIRRAAVYVAHRRIAKSYRSGRVFLAGDAAHLMPPFAGHGLNAGIRDALNIGWKIADVVNGRGTDALLNSYELERRPHAKEMIRISGALGAIVMTRGRVRSALRDNAVRAANRIPSARRWLSGMRFIKPPDYSAGVAVSPLADVPERWAALVGRPVPQPTVELSDGSHIALDRALGDSWALIEVGGTALQRASTDAAWSPLGIAAVKLTKGVDPLPLSDRTLRVLGDPDGVLGDNETSAPTAVLVRPDRYVAAAFTSRGEQTVITAMSKYLKEIPTDRRQAPR
jgi:3-(3-hydroxy-phenyl)propionate hydroxylase